MRIALNMSPPAVVIHRSEKAGKGLGKTNLFIVTLPHDAPEHLRLHELRHVRQWWVTTVISAAALAGIAFFVPFVSYYIVALSIGVFGLLYATSTKFRFDSELSAYAISYINSPKGLDKFADVLSGDIYRTGHNKKYCRDAIIERATKLRD